jgi:predicted 2-oxoglutarate/Fe(II)-dependent dioxygenase YbiX
MLNDNFEGGEFYLEDELIPINLGEMIEFDANRLHRVKKVTKGNREVLVIWMKWNKKNKKSLL